MTIKTNLICYYSLAYYYLVLRVKVRLRPDVIRF